MRKIILFFILLLACMTSFSQVVKFHRTYGGGDFDEGRAIIQLPDSGYIVCGNTTGFGAELTDVLIFRTDVSGEALWYKHVGGNLNDKAHDMIPTQDGNFALAGYTESFGAGGFDMYLVKADENGDTLFTRTYGGADWDFAYSIDTTFDGGMIIAGETYSYGNGNADGYLIKTDAHGDTLWTLVLGGPEDDVFRMAIESYDSTIYVIGTTKSYGAGGSDVWLVAVSQAGDTLLTKTYGTALDEFGYSLDDYFDGAGFPFLMLGSTVYDTLTNFYKPVLSRVRLNGELLYDLLYINFGGDQEEDLVHLKRMKNENNKFFYSGKNRFTEDGNSYNVKVTLTKDGGFYDTLRIITNPAIQIPYDVIETLDNGYAIVGSSTYYGPGLQAALIIKYDSLLNFETNVLVGVEEIAVIDHQLKVWPNPVNDYLNIQLQEIKEETVFILRDIQGRSLLTENLTQPMNQYDLSALPPGLYVAEFYVKGVRYYHKLVKQ